jgi:23S rRNA (pseudouridine1915-N3)-methyltransferase
MRLTIVCVGRAKGGPETELFERYVGRLPWSVAVVEVEERRKLPVARRIEREAELLLGAVPDAALVVALDEIGRTPTSVAFAKLIDRWRQDRVRDVAFLIGGADGLGETVRRRAALVMALSAMTLPHLLVRPVLAEQLYRAYTILTGHPYHKT